MTEVRRAVAADAPRIAQIAELAYAPYPARMGGQRPRPMDEDYDAAVREHDVWVAESDGLVVGFLVLVPRADDLLLDGVAVDPAYHGSGVGRLLLTLAEDEARAAAYARISLYTHRTMVENQRLYERIGYVETGRADDDGFARVFYEKDLHSPRVDRDTD